jgi:hypothetical protein
MSKRVIYIVGVSIFGLLYVPLERAIPGPVFLAAAVVYAILLRLIAERHGK